MGQAPNLPPLPGGRPSRMAEGGPKRRFIEGRTPPGYFAWGCFRYLGRAHPQVGKPHPWSTLVNASRAGRRAASTGLRSCPHAARHAKTPSIKRELGEAYMTVLIAGG